MNNICKFFSISIVIISCSCNPINFDNQNSVDQIDIHEDLVSLTNEIKCIGMVRLESNDLSMVGSFTRLVVSENNFYLLDNKFKKTVLKFNMEGHFIKSYGSFGKGPGEQTNVDWFSVDKTTKQIALFDASLRKLSIYNSENGDMVKEVNVNFSVRSFEFLPNGMGFVFYCSYSFHKPYFEQEKIKMESGYSYQLIMTDDEGKIKKLQIAYPDDYRAQNFTMINSVFSQFRDSLTIFSQYNDTLYSISKEGELFSKFLIDYGNNNQLLSTQYCDELGPNPVIDFKRNSGFRRTSGIYRLMSQLQTQKHIRITGVRNSSPFCFIIDKQTKNVFKLGINNQLVFNHGFRASDENYFYSLVFATDYAKSGTELYNLYPMELQRMIKESEDEDNPIILIWEIDSF